MRIEIITADEGGSLFLVCNDEVIMITRQLSRLLDTIEEMLSKTNEEEETWDDISAKMTPSDKLFGL